MTFSHDGESPCSPAACPRMVEVHAARLVPTADAGGGPKRGDGEHHAGVTTRMSLRLSHVEAVSRLWRLVLNGALTRDSLHRSPRAPAGGVEVTADNTVDGSGVHLCICTVFLKHMNSD